MFRTLTLQSGGNDFVRVFVSFYLNFRVLYKYIPRKYLISVCAELLSECSSIDRKRCFLLSARCTANYLPGALKWAMYVLWVVTS